MGAVIKLHDFNATKILSYFEQDIMEKVTITYINNFFFKIIRKGKISKYLKELGGYILKTDRGKYYLIPKFRVVSASGSEDVYDLLRTKRKEVIDIYRGDLYVIVIYLIMSIVFLRSALVMIIELVNSKIILSYGNIVTMLGTYSIGLIFFIVVSHFFIGFKKKLFSNFNPYLKTQSKAWDAYNTKKKDESEVRIGSSTPYTD